MASFMCLATDGGLSSPCGFSFFSRLHQISSMAVLEHISKRMRAKAAASLEGEAQRSHRITSTIC